MTAQAIGAGLLGAVATPTLLARSCSRQQLRPLKLGTNSLVRAADGSLLGVIPAKRNRQQLALTAMSPWLPQATIAIEDRRFWQHGALDYQGIVRAALTDLERGHSLQGGSSLTQQLARNLYIGKPKRTLRRKLEEACLALKLAQRMNKRQILGAYLNVVYYGHRAYGVEAAAQTYFSRHASRVTVWQAALLAGLPQAPSVYDPLRNPRVARARRNEVLRAMFAARYLKRRAYQWAYRQPLGLHPSAYYRRIREPYFFGYVDQQLVSRYGQALVESGGLRVQTTIDPRLQFLAQRTLASVLKSRDDPAGALVAIDPRDGRPARWRSRSRAASGCSSTSPRRGTGRRVAPSSRSRSPPRSSTEPRSTPATTGRPSS